MEHILFIFAETPDNVLYGYGPLGVGVVALTAALYKLFNILLNDRDSAIKQRDALLEDFFTKILPALTKSTEVLEKRQELDKQMLEESRDSTVLIRENNRLLLEISYALKAGRGNAQTGGN